MENQRQTFAIAAFGLKRFKNTKFKKNGRIILNLY